MNPLHLLGHFLIALTVGVVSYLKTANPWFILLSLFVSFAIDTDHFFDYWTACGFNLNLKRFFSANYFEINKKVFVPFHSWELIVFVFSLSFTGPEWFFKTIALAMFFHILWDSISYKIFPWDYSIIWRGLHGFNVKKNK